MTKTLKDLKIGDECWLEDRHSRRELRLMYVTKVGRQLIHVSHSKDSITTVGKFYMDSGNCNNDTTTVLVADLEAHHLLKEAKSLYERLLGRVSQFRYRQTPPPIADIRAAAALLKINLDD